MKLNTLTTGLIYPALLFAMFIALFVVPAFAEDISIDMLNKRDDGAKMVYSQDIARIDVGDTITWLPKSKGHNVEFISKNGVPEGVDKFKSKVNKDTEFTFTIPGIYAYWCTPHKTMGMIGFVIVGDDKSNLDSIKKVKFGGKSKKIAKGLIAEIEG